MRPRSDSADDTRATLSEKSRGRPDLRLECAHGLTSLERRVSKAERDWSRSLWIDAGISSSASIHIESRGGDLSSAESPARHGSHVSTWTTSSLEKAA
jgi:hypothetical protein